MFCGATLLPNYLRGNGDLRWGGLSISGGSATFTGTIYADRLVGQINDGQVGYGLNAGKLTNGYMSGDRMYGGTPALNGITSLGSSMIVTGGIYATGSIISGSTVQGINLLSVGNATIAGYINAGSYRAGGYSGITNTITVVTPYGNRYLQFNRGIFVGYS